MNKTVYHGILFALLINIVTGIATIGMTDINNNPLFTGVDTALLGQYNANNTVYFQEQTNKLINPAGVTEDKGNLVFRLLDLIGLGFINQLISIVNHYMYGFIDILQNLFGSWLNPTLFAFLFGTAALPLGAFKIFLTIGYVLAGIELWTNKSITD